MLTAQQLLNKVQKEKPRLVESMRLLSDAYIELAYCSVSHLRKQQHGMILCNAYYILISTTVPVQLPPSCKLVKLSCLHEIAVPTVDVKVWPASTELVIMSVSIVGRSYLFIQ